MKYDEDFRQDMILYFIEFVKEEYDPITMKATNNYVVISYIKKVLYHHYVYLSKIKNKINSTEFSNDYISLENNSVEVEDENISKINIYGMLKDILTDSEYKCFDLLVMKKYNINHIAKTMNISRQALNQCKLRAIRKIKKLILQK